MPRTRTSSTIGARVTIRFFRLNRAAPEGTSGTAEGRENLYRGRAEALSTLADCLDAIETSSNVALLEARKKKVERLTAPASPHTNRCRSFLRLWAEPATRAQAIALGLPAETYLQSQQL